MVAVQPRLRADLQKVIATAVMTVKEILFVSKISALQISLNIMVPALTGPLTAVPIPLLNKNLLKTYY